MYLLHRIADPSRVGRMCSRMVHRGPDDEGIYTDGGCGIGMRRLSIIDLSGGHQPMSNEDGTVWVVFNGEIYNFQELRKRLLDQGHQFKTNSDTETLVHLYEQEGIDGLKRLRGMFAYAIWDAPRTRLFLARDRFGKKPLYYAHLGDRFYFASEMKCFQDLNIPFDLDEEALRLYFLFGYIPDPASIFLQVRKLEAGGWLTLDANGTMQRGRYWRLPVPAEQAPPGLSREDAARRLRDLFDEAVRIRMIADVPLGAFLSGGIDSSSVVASMALQSSTPVKTFSVGFDDVTFSELPYARMVAEKYATEHHEIVVQPDAVELAARVAAFLDEPFGDSSAIPTFLVSEFTRKHATVALSGDGGDELFGGYESFFLADRLRRYDRLPQFVRGVMRFTADALPYSVYGKNYLRMISEPEPLARYLNLNYMPFYVRHKLLRPEWMLPADTARLRHSLAEYLAPPDASAVTQAMYFEATATLTGNMLVKVDRMSMANSLEVRCPMLDSELAEFAATLPHEWKMRGGGSGTGFGKRILLEALGDRLPPAAVQRKKRGFSLPLPNWFRGPLKPFLWDHLTGTTFQHRGWTQPKFVRHLLEEHDQGRRNNSGWLWRLLILELWAEQWWH